MGAAKMTADSGSLHLARQAGWCARAGLCTRIQVFNCQFNARAHLRLHALRSAAVKETETNSWMAENVPGESV
jgi:hypothetical protein